MGPLSSPSAGSDGFVATPAISSSPAAPSPCDVLSIPALQLREHMRVSAAPSAACAPFHESVVPLGAYLHPALHPGAGATGSAVPPSRCAAARDVLLRPHRLSSTARPLDGTPSTSTPTDTCGEGGGGGVPTDDGEEAATPAGDFGPYGDFELMLVLANAEQLRAQLRWPSAAHVTSLLYAAMDVCAPVTDYETIAAKPLLDAFFMQAALPAPTSMTTLRSPASAIPPCGTPSTIKSKAAPGAKSGVSSVPPVRGFPGAQFLCVGAGADQENAAPAVLGPVLLWALGDAILTQLAPLASLPPAPASAAALDADADLTAVSARLRAALVKKPNGLLRDDPPLVAAAIAALAAAVPAAVAWAARPSYATAAAALAAVGRDIGAVLLLVGCRVTVGSIVAARTGYGAVPPLRQLIDAFDRPHDPRQAFSVGARALAKHCHRGAEGWWGAGALSGSQQEKNAAAHHILRHRLLADVQWCNVHMLPHDIVTIELRCSDGYGVRWTSIAAGTDAAPAHAPATPAPVAPDAAGAGEGGGGEGPSIAPGVGMWGILCTEPSSAGTRVQMTSFPVRPAAAAATARTVEFRGFLEPQDPEGHEKGWRH